MSSNGGFPPLKLINNDKDKNIEKKEKERSFINKNNIVQINDIIKNVKNPMINLNKEEIIIIDDL